MSPPSVPIRRDVLAMAGGALGAAAMPGLAFAQSAPAPARPGQSVVVSGQLPVVSLQTWLDTYGRPTASVMVNGQGPFRFLVDTGSTTTVVSTRLARQLSLPSLPEKMVNSVTEQAMTPFALVTRLDVGATRGQGLRAAVMDGPAFANADGILGMDMFANKRVRFSLTRREVEVLPAVGGGGGLPITVPVTFRNGLLVETRGTVGNVRARFVLDTGAETSMMNPPLRDALLNGRPGRRFQEPAIVMGVTRTALDGLWIRVPTVDALGLKVTRLSVIAADSPVFKVWELDTVPAMIVGMDVLSGLEVIQIDYRRRQIQLRLLSLLSGMERVGRG